MTYLLTDCYIRMLDSEGCLQPLENISLCEADLQTFLLRD